MLVPNCRRIDLVWPEVQLSLSTIWTATLRLQAFSSASVTSFRSSEYIAIRIIECLGALLIAFLMCRIVRSCASRLPIGLLNIAPVGGSHALAAVTVPPPTSTTVVSTTASSFFSTDPPWTFSGATARCCTRTK